mmetsp:Transcript_48230/g.108621  ORF Transcript_48230/g.108621 Transcript_48230/m.108621 type:complete len:204 (-) Transcript_48230:1276-1887(-)
MLYVILDSTGTDHTREGERGHSSQLPQVTRGHGDMHTPHRHRHTCEAWHTRHMSPGMVHAAGTDCSSSRHVAEAGCKGLQYGIQRTDTTVCAQSPQIALGGWAAVCLVCASSLKICYRQQINPQTRRMKFLRPRWCLPQQTYAQPFAYCSPDRSTQAWKASRPTLHGRSSRFHQCRTVQTHCAAHAQTTNTAAHRQRRTRRRK